MTVCIVRKIPLVLTPEEKVRQGLLEQMIDRLGYPRGLIAVEKSLTELVQQPVPLPERRVDILVYKSLDPLAPLMLVECKKEALNAAAIRQALGYNLTLGAPWIVLANPHEVKTGHFHRGEGWVFRLGLPPFSQLSAS